jgi:hypothetical protein
MYFLLLIPAANEQTIWWWKLVNFEAPIDSTRSEQAF